MVPGAIGKSLGRLKEFMVCGASSRSLQRSKDLKDHMSSQSEARLGMYSERTSSRSSFRK
jgi:hypothetical protein